MEDVMNKKIMGALLVSMAATVVMAKHHAEKAAPTKPGAKVNMVCQNNSCKGKADCHGFGNASCGGNNECKGHGILKAKDKAECEKKTGIWTEEKA